MMSEIMQYVKKLDVLLEISKMSSMINNNDRARLRTKVKLSRCDLFKSLSRVNSVIPMIPFMGVLRHSQLETCMRYDNAYRISWDMLAKNSDFDLFANSAASLAAVFFWILSRKLNTI